jgi:hypothetical protein
MFVDRAHTLELARFGRESARRPTRRNGATEPLLAPARAIAPVYRIVAIVYLTPGPDHRIVLNNVD